jgi:hypothetical protein
MTDSEKDDLFYVCTIIEFTARRTNNKRGTVAMAMGENGVKKELHDACVNHCLSFEQVSDEWIEKYNIENGDFDTITGCKYSIPSETAIGGLYRILILNCAEEGKEVEELIKIFTSFISDEISDFKTGVYFENPSYLQCSYEEGYLLE